MRDQQFSTPIFGENQGGATPRQLAAMTKRAETRGTDGFGSVAKIKGKATNGYASHPEFRTAGFAAGAKWPEFPLHSSTRGSPTPPQGSSTTVDGRRLPCF